jgi:hypothetical protein
VALALVDFCIEHNCFTRTLSTYELAKWTAGLSPSSVSRALAALADDGFLTEVLRTDKRTTKRYHVNLRWAAGGRKGVSTTDAKNTAKDSLIQELQPPLIYGPGAGWGQVLRGFTRRSRMNLPPSGS